MGSHPCCNTPTPHVPEPRWSEPALHAGLLACMELCIRLMLAVSEWDWATETGVLCYISVSESNR